MFDDNNGNGSILLLTKKSRKSHTIQSPREHTILLERGRKELPNYNKQSQVASQKMNSATRTVLVAKLAVALFLVMASIQLCIAGGLVPITIIWGGSQQELTNSLRFASIVAFAILVFFAHIIWRRGTDEDPPKWIRIGSWIVTAYMILNTVGNLASTNDFERFVFGSLTVILAICGWIVSSSSTDVTRSYVTIDD